MRILFNHHISGAADFIEIMRRARPGLFVIATHERNDTPIKLVANRMLLEPAETRDLSPRSYADWLLEVALSEGAELVIPYRRRGELSEFREQFGAQGVRLLTAGDLDVMRLLDDKPRFLSHMEEAGAAITPFRIFSGPKEYEKLRSDGELFAGHPGNLCVKPTSGIYGSGFRILHDHIKANTTFSSLSSLELSDQAFRAMLAALPSSEPMMLMPFLPGPECSVDFACYEGRLLGTVSRFKTKTSQILQHDPYSEELARLIVGKFGLTGVLNLQTIVDAHGVPRLLELNSRTSGGIGMTGLTNVNLPGLLLDALDGHAQQGVFRVAGKVLAARREVFWSC